MRSALRNAILFPKPAFLPTSISGLQLWLKADVGLFQDAAKTTPATLDGDVVGAWVDQSGSGNDATQATAANKPTLKLNIVNGKPVVRFDGVDDLLDLPNIAQASPMYLYAVIDTTNLGTGWRLLLARSGPPWGVAFYCGTETGGANYRSSIYLHPTAYAVWPTAVQRWHIIRYYFLSNTTVGTRVDGGSETTQAHTYTTLSNWTGIAATGSQIAKIDAAELLLYQGVTLSSANDALILSYLNSKFSIY